jgi:hypothetical protein
VETSEAAPAPVAGADADIVGRALRLLADSKGERWVNKANLWPMIKRLDSTFDFKEHGHATLGEMIRSLDAIVEVRKAETDHQLRLR